MPAGRPSTYTPELGLAICEALAASDQGLRGTLEANPEFPTVQTVWKWRQKHAQFAQAFAHAKEQQLHMMAEDIVDISKDDSLEPNDKRIRIDTLKWLLSKLMHKTYGDKLDVTSGGEALAPPSHQIDARVQSIIMQAMERKRMAEPVELDAEALKLLD